MRHTWVFTDNPKVKHHSGSQAPELSKKQLKFLLSAFIRKMGLAGEAREHSADMEKEQTEGTGREVAHRPDVFTLSSTEIKAFCLSSV